VSLATGQDRLKNLYWIYCYKNKQNPCQTLFLKACTHTNDSELSFGGFEVDIAGSTLQPITNSQFDTLLNDLNNELDSKDGFDELLVNFNVDIIENINPNTSNNVKEC